MEFRPDRYGLRLLRSQIDVVVPLAKDDRASRELPMTRSKDGIQMFAGVKPEKVDSIFV